MSKIQEIEGKLLTVNDAVFQDLCDAYIALVDPLCVDGVHRSGSVAGKQKTKKGTPDSYFQTTSNLYVLLEYTTISPVPNRNPLLNKIKKDIDKCANSEITGIAKEQIAKLVYCLNSQLSLAEDNELKQYSRMQGITLEIKSLSTLALGLYSKANHLAKEFLNIAIDTGQILPTQAFVQAYEQSGYATSLSNQFVAREKETAELEAMIISSPITIITGVPGVGKTKLVMEVFDKFSKSNSNYWLYCIDNRHIPIYDDLKSYLAPDKNYILFIDDANRQLSNVKQILSLLKDQRSGELHIVMTVRDYAFEEINGHTLMWDPSILKLEKFTDEQLTTLLQSKDFNIQNPDYIKRLLEIAEGNPRLAIMGAKVAIGSQNLNSLNDVSDLYDRYFSNALDAEIFKDEMLLKTLGIVSFFNAINKQDDVFYEKLMQNFQLDRFAFEEALVKLEQHELIESSTDLSMVRISEQVLGTYFFYRTFFKHPVLPFDEILQNYFFSHHYRVKETIIPANNTFGYDNVNDKINPYLDKFWKQVQDEQDNAVKYLDIFWLYKQDDALGFVYKKIESLPAQETLDFLFDEKEANYGYHDRDPFLHILLSFYTHILPNLTQALELGACYIERNPKCYTHWVKQIKDAFIFNREDEHYGYYRQLKLVEFLCNKSKVFSETLRAGLFFDVAPMLMKTSFNVVAGARKRNSMSFYRYNLHLSKPLKRIRSKIWKSLRGYFRKHQPQALLFIHNYLQRTPDKVRQVFEFDLPFLKGLIHDFFKPDIFMHAYLVQDFIRWFKRMKISDEDFGMLLDKFNSPIYKTYSLLSFDWLRSRSEEDTRLDYKVFQERKEKEIRTNFSFADSKAFKQFYKEYIEIDNGLNVFGSTYRLSFSLDIVMEEAFKKSKTALNYIKHIALSQNETKYVPYRVFGLLAADQKAYEKFYDFIISKNLLEKDWWLNNWFHWLPEDKVTKLLADRYLELFRQTTVLTYVNLEGLNKFEAVSKGFIIHLLELVYERNSAKELSIRFYDLFDHHLHLFKEHIDLAKKMYLQQQSYADHFDHDFKDFLEILKIDPKFLLEYLAHWTDNKYYLSMREEKGLSIVWKHPDASALIEEALDWVAANHHYYIREEFATVFFENVSADFVDTAKSFLKFYLNKHFNDRVKVNMVFDSVRSCFPDAMENLLLHFLKIQPSFELFEKLEWTPHFYMGSGDTIFGDVRASQYEKVLVVLEKITEQPYRYVNHKAHIRERISMEKRSADRERKEKFMNNDW